MCGIKLLYPVSILAPPLPSTLLFLVEEDLYLIYVCFFWLCREILLILGQIGHTTSMNNMRKNWHPLLSKDKEAASSDSMGKCKGVIADMPYSSKLYKRGTKAI